MYPEIEIGVPELLVVVLMGSIDPLNPLKSVAYKVLLAGSTTRFFGLNIGISAEMVYGVDVEAFT